MKKIWIMMCFVVFLSGCAKQDPHAVSIADQYGIAYAPLEVMKTLGLLEKNLPKGYEVNWVKLGNTVGIREAMISGDVDIGFMGIPPFLIGRDKGMPWKIMTGLSESPLGLVTNDPSIKNLQDLVGRGKIALPQPGSIQHILLAMASERQLEDATAFDRQLISLNHPEGYQALLARTDVVAQFTTPPYLTMALAAPSVHLLLSGKEAFGDSFTFIVGVCQANVFENPTLYNGFLKALDEAMDYMEAYPDETATLLAKAYNMDLETIKQALKLEDLAFNRDIKGIEVFTEFMYRAGYIEQAPKTGELKWRP